MPDVVIEAFFSVFLMVFIVLFVQRILIKFGLLPDNLEKPKEEPKINISTTTYETKSTTWFVNIGVTKDKKENET